MDCRHFDDDRLSVSGDLLEGIDELPEVLDGVDIMMGSGGDCIGELWNHAGA